MRKNNNKTKEQKRHCQNNWAISFCLCLPYHVCNLLPKIPRIAPLWTKVVCTFVQRGSPNFIHPNTTKTLTTTPKRSPNTAFYTPFPSVTPYRHPNKNTPSRTTYIPSYSPPKTLKTWKKHCCLVKGDRGEDTQPNTHSLTQWPSNHKTTFVSSNHRTHHYP